MARTIDMSASSKIRSRASAFVFRRGKRPLVAWFALLLLGGCALSKVPSEETGSPLSEGEFPDSATGAQAAGGQPMFGSGGAPSGGASFTGGGSTGGFGSGGEVLTLTGGVTGSGGAPEEPLDITFYVVADTHADPPVESYDLRATARAINAVSKGGQWPSQIAGKTTGFAGGAIAPPLGVVFLGDITGWGTAPTEIASFKHHFQAGTSDVSISYPSYIGLGNHDLDSADREAGLAGVYRGMYWSFVDERHKGASAPVPVTSFDDASHSYSWDWEGVHLFQAHRCPGDVNYGLPSDLTFLQGDLAARAADGRPVVLFHHYGMDAFGSEERWWTAAQRTAYRNVLADYNVVGIFAGHSHGAFQYDWEGLHVMQVNNAKAEINSGNKDGNGSFAIARITAGQFSMVTCRWLDDQGNYELIEPFYNVHF